MAISNLVQIYPKYTPASSVIRANGSGVIPRFEARPGAFNSFIRWIKRANLEEPPYTSQSQARDQWLQQFWRQEPFLAGVINSVVLIDANRGWSITGGRNQVRKWRARLMASAGGEGWRHLVKKGSLSFWTTDMGAVFGTRREEPWATYADGVISKGPLFSLENIDPAMCQLGDQTGEPEELGGIRALSTMTYGGEKLYPWDYFRVASLPHDSYPYNDLGFSALSRCLSLAKLLYAVYEYNQEKFLAKAPRGLLLLHNISEQQWTTAMEAREQRMSAKERNYYGSVEVLASEGGDYNPDAKLVALSQLPDGFDQELMTNLLIYGYALCFGYDPREFWPASQGSLGTGRETQTQAEKSTGKGQKDFAATFQEKLQGELPETIHFEFDERDEQGELLQTEVQRAKAELIADLYNLRDGAGAVLANEEVRILLAQAGLIPAEWTATEEDVIATDEDIVRAMLLDRPAVRRACEMYPAEPIIRASYAINPVTGMPEVIERVLWPDGATALQPRLWPIKRQVDDEVNEYEAAILELAESLRAEEIDEGEFERRLTYLAVTILILAFLRGSDNSSTEAEELAQEVLTSRGQIEPDISLLGLPDEAVRYIQDEVTVAGQAAGALAAVASDPESGVNLAARAALWGGVALGLYHLGKMFRADDPELTWQYTPGKDHCRDCLDLDGVTKTASAWLDFFRETGKRPQGRALECGGWRCGCSLS